MEGAHWVVSAQMLMRLYMILLYFPAVCLGASLLYPRLSTRAKVLSTAMLIVQVLFALLTLEAEPASSLEKRLWYVDGEGNVFSAFAALQMALVGLLALAVSRRDSETAAWRRLYFIGLGLVFLFIAMDDYTGLFKSSLYTPWVKWKQGYIILGAATAALTLAMALRARHGDRIWYVCLLLGLSLIGTAGLEIDNMSRYCGVLGIFRLDDCLTYQPLEEGMEALGTWLSLLAVLGLYTGSRYQPAFLPRRALVPILVFVAGLLASYALQLPQELRRLALRYELANHSQAASVSFESGLKLLGFRTESEKWYEGYGGDRYVTVGLYVSSMRRSFADGLLGFGIHLVEQVTGESVAGLDARAGGKRGIWLFDTENSSTYRQWMEFEISDKITPINRALWIVLTVWSERDGEFIRQRVLASDLKQLGEAQVVLGELVREAESPPSAQVPLARFENGLKLIAAELPERARAGETMPLTLRWRSDGGGHEDFAQFLHFVHQDTGEWWGYDQQPLGPRLPTRLWYSGLADSETWQAPLPDDLPAGRYAVYTGLYRTRDLMRIPATDGQGQRFPDSRIELGLILIE